MAFPTIGIQSPYLRDHGKFHAVSDAQEALKKRGFYKGKIDGVLGPLTASSFAVAKWKLGYPKKQCTKTCGPTLMAYLRGTKKPTRAMRIRARRRGLASKEANRQRELRLHLVRELKNQAGITESPRGSNRCKFSVWYGLIGPWCAMFVSWGMWRLGYGKKWRYAYVPTIWALAHESRSGLRVIHPTEARSGDQYLCDWNRDGEFDHIGTLIGRVTDGRWHGVEGNTSHSNLSNGGAVEITSRSMSMGRFAFIRFDFH